MSEICLQFGQCGNQLGFDFFQTIYETDSTRSRWFRSSHKGDIARCMLIDSENKVVSMLLSNNFYKWQYRRENCVLSNGGCGNNWALGYFLKGPEMIDSIMDGIRLETEKCDRLRSFLTFMGSGGGTGSGIGSYVLQNLKDIFPNKYIISSLIIPLYNKENPVESYNTVLSLSKLHSFSDVITTFYNDFLFKQCSGLFKNAEFNFDALNFLISNQLTSLLKTYNSSTFVDDYISRMVSFPIFKILSLTSSVLPKTDSGNAFINWESFFKQLGIMLIKRDDNSRNAQISWNVPCASQLKMMNYYKSIANMVVCNGKNSDEAARHVEKSFQLDELYVPWVSKSQRFVYVSDNRPNIKYPYTTLINNSGVFHYSLDKILDRAWKSFHQCAYTHHYEQYGLEKEKFIFEFLNLENIRNTYNAL